MTIKVQPKSTTVKEPEGPSTPALADADTSTLTFVGRTEAITVPTMTCALERTTEGASSITALIDDPHLAFLNSPALVDVAPTINARKSRAHRATILRKANLHSEVVLDNLVWSLTGLELQPRGQTQAILEEDAVKALRNTKPLTMSRGAVTRAQFIKRMFDDAGVPLVCPELDIKQRIETPKEAETEKQKEHKRKPGLAAHAGLTVKTHPADSEQSANIERCLEIAAGKHAGELASEALLVAIIQENEARNTPGGGGTSSGILQLLASTAAGLGISQLDLTACVSAFLDTGFYGKGGAIALAKAHPTWTPGHVAQEVQGSEYPDAYDIWKDEAKKMVDAYTGGDAEGLTGETITYAKSYQYQRKKGETSWACGRRLAEEVNWYMFIEGGVGYLFSGPYLARSKPRMLVAPGADGIDQVTARVMASPQHEDTITVTCHARLWQAPPGSVAEVQGYGPLDDRWIVIRIVRPNMKLTTTTVTLSRPKVPKIEPAHELLTRPTTAIGGGSLTPDQSIVAKLAREHPEIQAGVREVVAIILGQFPLIITSTVSGTHASHSLHYEGRAVDLAGPNMDAAGKWIAQNLTSRLTEGIHNPTLSVKDKQTVSASFWGSEVWAEHINHIHVGV